MAQVTYAPGQKQDFLANLPSVPQYTNHHGRLNNLETLNAISVPTHQSTPGGPPGYNG